MTQDTPHDTVFEKSASHWGQFLGLMSMDLTAEAWPELGPAFSRDWDTVRTDLRAMIEGLRETAAADPETVPDIRERVFAENAMGWSQQDLADLAARGAGFVADHADDPHLSGWQIALGQFPDMFPETRAQVESTAEMEALLAPAASVVTVPVRMSAWDLQMCARHGWNPEDDAGFAPADTLDIVLGMARTAAALRHAAETFSPTAQAALHAEAQAILTEWGVWMPGPLSPLMLRTDHAGLH